MINSGVPDSIVDFWLGHAIGEMTEAYKSVQAESLRSMYLERERLISITLPKVDVKELEAKLKIELDQQSRQLQSLVNGLAAENLGLRNEVRDLKEKVNKHEDHFKKIRDKLDLLMEESIEDTQEYFRHLHEKRLIREDQEAREAEQEMMEEFHRQHPSEPLTPEEIAEAKQHVK